MLKVYFLKKKRYYKYKNNDFFSKVKTGTIFFFEYISLDRDLFYKYRIYGLCVGIKRNFLMSSCYLNSVIYGNQINYTFYIFSPLIYNIKIFGNIYIKSHKIYGVTPKLRVFKQIVV